MEGEKRITVEGEDGTVGQFPASILDEYYDGLKGFNASVFLSLINSDTSNLLRQQLVTRIASNLQSKFLIKDRQAKVTINEVLTNTEQEELTKVFPDLNIVFTSRSLRSHGYASASRKCERVILLNKCGVNVAENKNKILIKEVGGDIVSSVLSGERNLHACSPILSTYDGTRFTNRKMRAVTKLQEGVIADDYTFQILKDFSQCKADVTNSNFCFSKSQDCTINAQVLIFLHSTYDIKLIELGNAMDRANALVGYGCMTFSSKIFTDDEGIIPVLGAEFHIKRNFLGNRSKIVFGFKTCSGFNYEHDYETYESYFTTSQFMSSGGKSFSLELLEHRNGIQFFKVSRLEKFIGNPTTHRIYMTHLKNKYLIRFPHFYYNSSNKDKYLHIKTESGKVVKIRANRFKEWRNLPKNTVWQTFEVDADVVDKTCAYVLGATEEKFKPEQISTYIRSITTREIMFSSVAQRKDLPPIDALCAISHAIYITLYHLKYVYGKTLQQAIRETNALRNGTKAGNVLKEFNHDYSWWAKLLSKLRGRNVSNFNPRMFITEPVAYLEFRSTKDGTNHLVTDNTYTSFFDAKNIVITARILDVEDPGLGANHMIPKFEIAGTRVPKKWYITRKWELFTNNVKTSKNKVKDSFINTVKVLSRSSVNVYNGTKSFICSCGRVIVFPFKISAYGVCLCGKTIGKIFCKGGRSIVDFSKFVINGTAKKIRGVRNTFSKTSKNTKRMYFKTRLATIAAELKFVNKWKNNREAKMERLRMRGDVYLSTTVNLQPKFQKIDEKPSGPRKLGIIVEKLDRCNSNIVAEEDFVEIPLDVIEPPIETIKIVPTKTTASLKRKAPSPPEALNTCIDIPTEEVSFVELKISEKLPLPSSPLKRKAPLPPENKTLSQPASETCIDIPAEEQPFVEQKIPEELLVIPTIIPLPLKRKAPLPPDYKEPALPMLNENLVNDSKISETLPVLPSTSTNTATTIPEVELGRLSEINVVTFGKVDNSGRVVDQLSGKDVQKQKSLPKENFSKMTTVELRNEVAAELSKVDVIDIKSLQRLEELFLNKLEKRGFYPRLPIYNVLENSLNVDGSKNECCFFAACEGRGVDLSELRNTIKTFAINNDKYDKDLQEELTVGNRGGRSVLEMMSGFFNVSFTVRTSHGTEKIGELVRPLRVINLALCGPYQSAHYYYLNTCKEEYSVEVRRDNMYAGLDLNKFLVELRKVIPYVDIGSFGNIKTINKSGVYFLNNLSKYCSIHAKCRNNNMFGIMNFLHKNRKLNISIIGIFEIDNFDVTFLESTLEELGGIGFRFLELKNDSYFSAIIYHTAFVVNDKTFSEKFGRYISSNFGTNHSVSHIDSDTNSYRVSKDNKCNVVYGLVDEPNVLIKIRRGTTRDNVLELSSPTRLDLVGVGTGVVFENEDNVNRLVYNYLDKISTKVPVCQIISDFTNINIIETNVKLKARLLYISMNKSESFDQLTHYNYLPNITDLNRKKNAMIEQLSIWSYEKQSIISSLKNGFEVVRNSVLTGNEVCGLIDNTFCLFNVKTRKFEFGNEFHFPYNWGYTTSGLINTTGLFDNSGKVNLTAYKMIKDSFGYIAFSRASKFMHNMDFISKFTVEMLEDFNICPVTFVQGVPGAGKTEYILENNIGKPHNIILTVTKEAREDMLRRSKEKKLIIGKDRIRTVDSLLLNNVPLQVEELWIDEAFLVHAGTWLWAVRLTRCNKLVIVGDQAQIPYINREGLEVYFSFPRDWNFDSKYDLNTNHRNPLDVVTWLANEKFYDFEVFGTSLVKKSVAITKIYGEGDVKFHPKSKVLVFTQSEKKTMLNLGADVSTIHEYQGNQCDDIILVRLNNKEADRIYKSMPHILVGLTRHRKSFNYYTVIDNDSTSNEVKKIMSYPDCKLVSVSKRGNNL
ncbi:replicase [Aedes camptorhynchus negev-like virus]|uniref:replicase n=1 Tax=Aedes camptorhynchus negev-like virus TaxID=2010268 RepID=UPI000B4FAE3D|nr:replicase [Aedes camptorhynchus negev-like virus]ASA47359.1 replicase [Aedes camptorhynchus negev-like virus]